MTRKVVLVFSGVLFAVAIFTPTIIQAQGPAGSSAREIQTEVQKNEPRVVRINENFVDAVPSGFMLIITNVDRPGIIGSLGTILGENDINIAGMTVGRKEVGKNAVTVVNVDSVVPKEVLKKIETLPDIVNCNMVEL